MNTTPNSLAHLCEHELLEHFEVLVTRDRCNTAQLLVAIGEIDQRKLWARHAFQSMFVFCVERFHMSEQVTAKRIWAARTARRFPVILEMVERGELHLSAIHLLARHLTAHNCSDVLRRARHKSSREIERLVAELAPRPDVVSSVRALPRTVVGAARAGWGSAGANGAAVADSDASAGARLSVGAVDSNASTGAGTDAAAIAGSDGSAGAGSNASGIAGATAIAGSNAFASADTNAGAGAGSNAFASAGSNASAGVGSGASAGAGLNAGAADPSASATLANPASTLASPAPAAVQLRAAEARGGAHVSRPTDRPITALSPRRYKIEITVDEETHDKLRSLQDLVGRSPVGRDPAAIISRAIDVLLVDTLKRKAVMTERPRPAASARNASAMNPGPQSRSIPAALRRTVWRRDCGRCCYVDDRGRRCNATRNVEFHHKNPFALGGRHDTDNVELRCAAHNQYQADLDFGRDFMDARRGAGARPRHSPRNAA